MDSHEAGDFALTGCSSEEEKNCPYPLLMRPGTVVAERPEVSGIFRFCSFTTASKLPYEVSRVERMQSLYILFGSGMGAFGSAGVFS